MRLVDEPAGGVPAVITTPAQFATACIALHTATGPVALDVERAGGFRYSGRAYLIQVHRQGAPTLLFDPLCWDRQHEHYSGVDVAPLQEILSGPQAPPWVLHAATQDLPSLALEGLRPRELFDTELAGRLLGLPRVALGVMTERLLGIGLEKGFSAVDWSRRPLPQPWLRYAALDVEFLLPLREALVTQLEQAGKGEWARQECAYLVEHALTLPEATEHVQASSQAWRRISGVHRLRHAQELALVQALWQRRDEIARTSDTAPSRLLHDRVIIEAAHKKPTSRAQFQALPTMAKNIGPARYYKDWVEALTQALALPADQWPQLHAPNSAALPPVRTWRERNPAAAARLTVARAALATVSQRCNVPTENLLWPEALRQLCWHNGGRTASSPSLSVEQVSHVLTQAAARDWQVQLCASPVAQALRALEHPEQPPAEEQPLAEPPA